MREKLLVGIGFRRNVVCVVFRMLQQGEKYGERVLHDAFGGVAGNVFYYNVFCFCIFQINIVHPSCRQTNQFEVRTRVEDGFVDDDFVRDDDCCVGNVWQTFIGGSRGKYP